MKFDKVVKARASRGHVPLAAGTDRTFWVVLGFSEAAVRWYVLGWLDRYPDHYRPFALVDPSTPLDELGDHKSVPATVELGPWEKCANAVKDVREYAERALSMVD